MSYRKLKEGSRVRVKALTRFDQEAYISIGMIGEVVSSTTTSAVLRMQDWEVSQEGVKHNTRIFLTKNLEYYEE